LSSVVFRVICDSTSYGDTVAICGSVPLLVSRAVDCKPQARHDVCWLGGLADSGQAYNHPFPGRSSPLIHLQSTHAAPLLSPHSPPINACCPFTIPSFTSNQRMLSPCYPLPTTSSCCVASILSGPVVPWPFLSGERSSSKLVRHATLRCVYCAHPTAVLCISPMPCSCQHLP